MNHRLARPLGVWLVLLAAVLSCNLPSNALPPSPTPKVAISMTIARSPTGFAVSMTPPALTASNLPSPTLTMTSSPEVTSTPQNPLVLEDVLCYGGPGKAYEVISTIRAGTRVVLLGIGMEEGWWVVKNPTYHDPCWLPVGSLQIDPAFNITALPHYRIPPTPTP